MKAAYFTATGSADVIEYGDLPTPEPKAGEVRVKVLAAGLNPIDVYTRAGKVPGVLPSPFVTGTDLAGVVEAVGPGATRFSVGDRVWASNQGLLGRPGTFAEFCCPHEDYVYPIPLGASDLEMAAIALVGITAHLGLFYRVNLVAGETVFVNGGTGGVGSTVLQMAKAAGAKVICTVGTVEKAEVARGFGADTVINYATDDVTAAVLDATAGKGVDVYYETQPPNDFDAIVARTAPFGRVTLMAGRAARPAFPNGAFYVKGLSLYGFAMFNVPPDIQRKCAEAINAWVHANELRPLIGKVFPLSEAAAAHRLQDDNTVGKAGTLMGKVVVLPGS